MPSASSLSFLNAIPPLRASASRLARRRFGPLAQAPKIQGRWGEFRRLWTRLRSGGDESLAYEANDWLMRTMAGACRRSEVTAVHSFEDCSLWQFEEARRLGKTCIYDMPIGYYPAWEQTQTELAEKYRDWLPPGGLPSSRFVRPEQKRREMELADIVLVPSPFVRDTVNRFVQKRVVLAPYGIDSDYWNQTSQVHDGPLVFLCAGQLSIRKGTPLLLEAWRRAGIEDAKLYLVGSWQLSPSKKHELPADCEYVGPVSRDELRSRYQGADVFVLPSFFEGRALVGGEAMACGLPVITTHASGLSDLVDDSCGRCLAPGDLDALVDSLRWFAAHRDQIPAMKAAARMKAERSTWQHYRNCVAEAVAGCA